MSLTSRSNALDTGTTRSAANRAARHHGLKSKFYLFLTELSWRQWLVLFIMGMAVIFNEVHSHSRMWQEHQSGQTFWTDPDLPWEILFYGLVIPILGGLIFAYMGRTAAERDRIARELELRQELVRQFYEAQNWQELVERIVTTPGGLVSADRAWLLAQHASDKEIEQIIHWERPGNDLLPASAPVFPAVCMRCLETVPLTGTRILTCHHQESENSHATYERYCLWLRSTGMNKAALMFDVSADHPLAPNELRLMDDLVSEMSLAFENVNLHDLELRQIDAARQERLQVARDLHDTLGQNISYLRLKLEQLNTTHLASDGKVFQDALVDMLTAADEAYDQLRNTLDTLRMTEQPSLEEAIQLYADQATSRAGFCVSVHSSGQTETLSPRQTRQMGYIAHEALNNIEKHAGAKNVDVHLQWHNHVLTLTVRDDGMGFNQQKPNGTEGYGLIIMAERSQAIHADLDIRSAPGDGTEVSLSLPLSSSASTVLVSQ